MFNIYSGKRVWISGTTGFKGSWLALWLTKLGATVKGYSLHPNAFPNHFNLLYNEEKSDTFNQNFYQEFHDIRNIGVLYKSIHDFQPDLIFHLSSQALVLDSWDNPSYTFETNIQGTVNVLNVCKDIKSVKGVCVIVTDKIYKDKDSIYPYRETDELGVNSPYAASKACAELVCQSYRKIYAQNNNKIIASVMAGNTIGGGDWAKDRIIPDYIKAIQKKEKFVLRNPYAVRPYTYCLDILTGYLLVGERILQGSHNMNTSFNFGADYKNEVSNEILISLLQTYYPYDKVKISKNSENLLETNILTLDSTKARKILGWKPLYNIDTTVSETMRWYKEYITNNKVISEQQIEDYVKEL